MIIQPNLRMLCACCCLILTVQLAGADVITDPIADPQQQSQNQPAAVGRPETQLQQQQTQLPPPKPQPEPAVVLQQGPSLEIDINSIDGSSERHHYEQPTDQSTAEGAKPLVQMLDIPLATNNDADLYHGPSKPEPRNQQDDSLQQQDPAIIDHRPPANQQQQQQQIQSIQQQQMQLPAPAQQSSPIDQSASQNQVQQVPPIEYQASVQMVQPSSTIAPPLVQVSQNSVQQSQTSATIGAPVPMTVTSTPPMVNQVSAATTWTQTQTNQAPLSNYLPQQSSQSSASSAQVSVQVPAPQPQPQRLQSQAQQQHMILSPPASNLQTFGNQVASSSQVVSIQQPVPINNIITDHQSQSGAPVTGIMSTHQMQNQQVGHQMINVNGQPMMLMGSNVLGATSRRIPSISGWLKGISSMLANIFNRREHGLQVGIQPGSNGPNGLGHWVQMGSNNPPQWIPHSSPMLHQQTYQMHHNQPQQHQPQMVSPPRYATYVPAPVQMIQQQSQPVIASNQQPTQASQPPSTQQQPIIHQATDLQVSGSSTSFITVSPPPAPSQQQQLPIQQQLQQQPSIIAPSVVGIGDSAPASITQSMRQAANSAVYQASAPTHPQSISTPQQTTSVSTQSVTQTLPNQNQNQIVKATVAPALPQAQQLPPPVAPGQPRYGRSSVATTSGLPLAHYSRYAATSDK